MSYWIEQIKQYLSSSKNIAASIATIILLQTSQDLCANINRISLNAPGAQSVITYNPWDTTRVITNESGMVDSVDFTFTSSMADYRFTQQLLSTLSIPNKITTLVVKIEKILPTWSVPNHTVLFDPNNAWELYRKIFPLPTWSLISTNWFLNSSPLPSWTSYGLARDPLILPIELTDFQGTINSDWYPILYWNTSSEISNREFVIERSIDGASSFQEIGRIVWLWSPSQGNLYNFIDSAAINRENDGYLYYRLKQIDLNNEENLFWPIVLKFLFPKSSNFWSSWILYHWWVCHIPWLDYYEIYTVNGQKITEWSGPDLTLSNTPPGTYFLYDRDRNYVIQLLLIP